MTKPNFKKMSKADLRTYILQHPDDNEAFYELSNRIRANAKPVNSLQELEELIKHKDKSKQP